MHLRTVALHGNYYDHNFGDLLLFKVFERWVRAALDCRIIYPYVPAHERERFQADFPEAEVGLSRGDSWDALIYCGGGLFGDAGADGRFMPGHFAKRFLREYVVPAERSIWTRRPYAVIGPGCGPLTNVFVRYEAGRIFRHARVVSVRDDESVRFVREELGVRGTIGNAPDPAVTVSREDIPAAAVAAVARLVEPYRDRILLAVHHPRDYLHRSPASQAMREALIAALRPRTDVVPVLFSDIGTRSSLVHMQELAALLRAEAGRESLIVPFAGTWVTAALLARMSAVLTTKLHVGIVSYALGVYAESFALHPKTLRFYEITARSAQAQLFDTVDRAAADTKIQRAIAAGSRRGEAALTGPVWQETRVRAAQHGRWVAEFLRGVWPS